MSLTRFWSLFVVLGGLSAGGLLAGCSEASPTPSGTTNAGGGGAGGGDSTGGAGGVAGGGSSSSSGSGGPIVCSPDGDGTINETSCSLIAQDCGQGESCRPNQLGTATNCEKGAGVKGPGADCTETNECSAGQYCVFNHCSPICCKDAPAASCGNAPCSVSITFGQGFLWTCNFAKSCTLFANDCPQDPFVYECHYDPGQQIATCATNSGANTPEGQPCAFVNDCGNNMICTGGVCRNNCLLANWMNLMPGKGGCPPMQTCTMQSDTIGVCQP